MADAPEKTTRRVGEPAVKGRPDRFRPDGKGEPQPREKPLPSDCCDTGCDVCVFDAYADELAD